MLCSCRLFWEHLLNPFQIRWVGKFSDSQLAVITVLYSGILLRQPLLDQIKVNRNTKILCTKIRLFWFHIQEIS